MCALCLPQFFTPFLFYMCFFIIFLCLHGPWTCKYPEQMLRCSEQNSSTPAKTWQTFKIVKVKRENDGQKWLEHATAIHCASNEFPGVRCEDDLTSPNSKGSLRPHVELRLRSTSSAMAALIAARCTFQDGACDIAPMQVKSIKDN